MKKTLLLIGVTAGLFVGNATFASDGAEALQRFNERNKQFFQQQQENKEKSEKKAELARQTSERETLSTAQGEVNVSNSNEKTN
ncbi:hypothetical protein [Pseudomonas sp. AMR01]|uniref:hypothetical protein n=1 Tax=Pseudomonas sp. AMR01 TaxID=3064904 RepID=UPI0035C18DEB